MTLRKFYQIVLSVFGPLIFRIFGTILLLGLTSSTVAAESMKIVYFQDYPPFSWSQNNQMQGILIDALDEALKNRMHIDLSHKGLLWKQAQLLVKNGDADAFVTVPTQKRRVYTQVSRESVISAKVKVFTWKGNPQINALAKVTSYSELIPFKLVDYSGDGRAERALNNMNVHWLPTMDEIPPFLALGKADAWTQNVFVAKFFLKNLGYKEKIIELSNVLSTASFHLCIGKDSSFIDILARFDKTIKEMREDGTLDKIFRKYL